MEYNQEWWQSKDARFGFSTREEAFQDFKQHINQHAINKGRILLAEIALREMFINLYNGPEPLSDKQLAVLKTHVEKQEWYKKLMD